MKYVVLDEIALEILCDDDGSGNKKIFETEVDAIKYAEEKINAWQVIEIAWHTK